MVPTILTLMIGNLAAAAHGIIGSSLMENSMKNLFNIC
jgi:hypothetical protein